mmetsp:Transcript_12639/g.38128  ORF Transcript_12639/g.38128 Transcript_12639/m.38128 type:complete len:248 (-) Transcript_12639:191-934(-)
MWWQFELIGSCIEPYPPSPESPPPPPSRNDSTTPNEATAERRRVRRGDVRGDAGPGRGDGEEGLEVLVGSAVEGVEAACSVRQNGVVGGAAGGEGGVEALDGGDLPGAVVVEGRDVEEALDAGDGGEGGRAARNEVLEDQCEQVRRRKHLEPPPQLARVQPARHEARVADPAVERPATQPLVVVVSELLAGTAEVAVDDAVEVARLAGEGEAPKVFVVARADVRLAEELFVPVVFEEAAVATVVLEV